MCKCHNIRVGSYDNQVLIEPLFTDKLLSIDRCLIDEIKYLWDSGIVTTGCCCGHNYFLPYIGVTEESIPIMLDLGYVVYTNSLYLERKDSFYPKSISLTPFMVENNIKHLVDILQKKR